MNSWIKGLAMGAAILAQASYATNTLTKTNVLVVDGKTNAFTVWIPYIGKLSNICGIAIVPAEAFAANAEDLTEALTFSAGQVGMNDQGVLANTLRSKNDTQLYGEFVTIHTRSGRSFTEEMHGLISKHTTGPQAVDHRLVILPQLCE